MKPFYLSNEKEFDLEVESRCRLVNPPFSVMPHHHEYYEFVLITQGTATHTVNGKDFFLKKGSLCFVRKDDVHGLIDSSPDFRHVNFSFSQNSLNALSNFYGPGLDISSLLLPKYAPTTVLTTRETLNLYYRLSELFAPETGEYSKASLKFKSRYMMSYIFTNYFTHIIDIHSEIPYWLEYAYNEMKLPKNFIAGYSKMVELSGRSPEHLSRSLTKYYNTSPTNYITGLRLSHAATLLATTSLTATDICYECGFNNLTWFYQIFSKHYSMTPVEYRKKFGSSKSKQ